jgi:hypothetical protein
MLRRPFRVCVEDSAYNLWEHFEDAEEDEDVGEDEHEDDDVEEDDEAEDQVTSEDQSSDDWTFDEGSNIRKENESMKALDKESLWRTSGKLVSVEVRV